MYMQRWLLGTLTALLVLAGLPWPVAAQTYTIAPYAKVQFFDNNGDPCAGCLLNAYTTGTTTRLDTYSDTVGTLNANPVVLDAYGRASIFLSANTYRFVLTNSAATTTYWTQDGIAATHSGVTGVSNAGDLTFQVDTDNNGTNVFSFTDGTSVQRAQINEAGDLQIDDDLTVGDATEADHDIVFDGNAQDFYVCLDDSVDDLVFGLGSACGTTPAFSITEALATSFNGNTTFGDAVSDLVTVTGMFANTSLRVADTNASHALVITPGSNITTDRIFTLTTGDAAVTANFTATAAGTFSRSDGTNWAGSTLVLPNAATVNRIPFASATNTWSDSAGLTFDGTDFLTTGDISFGGGALIAT